MIHTTQPRAVEGAPRVNPRFQTCLLSYFRQRRVAEALSSVPVKWYFGIFRTLPLSPPTPPQAVWCVGDLPRTRRCQNRRQTEGSWGRRHLSVRLESVRERETLMWKVVHVFHMCRQPASGRCRHWFCDKWGFAPPPPPPPKSMHISTKWANAILWI